MAVFLGGCAATPEPRVTHEVRFAPHNNDFLQKREVASWSMRYSTDAQGNHWPSGHTLSARAMHYHDGRTQRRLVLRHDEPSPLTAPAIYEQTRAEQERLRLQCRQLNLVVDGNARVLPILSLVVRALTTSSRMPVAPTDYTPDPVVVLVGNNVSERFVVSTMVQAEVEPRMWQELAQAQRVEYEFCGDWQTADGAELDGLRKVIAASQP